MIPCCIWNLRMLCILEFIRVYWLPFWPLIESPIVSDQLFMMDISCFFCLHCLIPLASPARPVALSNSGDAKSVGDIRPSCVSQTLFLRAFLFFRFSDLWTKQGDCLPHRSDSPTKRLLWWYWYQWGRSLTYLCNFIFQQWQGGQAKNHPCRLRQHKAFAGYYPWLRRVLQKKSPTTCGLASVCGKVVCVWGSCVCVSGTAGGGGEGGGGGGRKCTTKNKNPTQRCGEKYEKYQGNTTLIGTWGGVRYKTMWFQQLITRGWPQSIRLNHLIEFFHECDPI